MHPSEIQVVTFLTSLMKEKLSYSVVNCHKAMLFQTLPFFGITWVDNSFLIPKLMKGFFNSRPVKPRPIFVWDVSVVLKFLSTLFPVEELTLKLLTFKLIALIALTTASRAQTLSALDISLLSKFHDRYIFQFKQLLKTSKPGKPAPTCVLHRYIKEELCVIHTLDEYLKRTKTKRKSTKLFVSFLTFKSVTTCTLARWLRQVLQLAGIDESNFSAHSFRGASASKALQLGVSINDIMKTANWSSSKTFYRFYHKEVISENNFASVLLNS